MQTQKGNILFFSVCGQHLSVCPTMRDEHSVDSTGTPPHGTVGVLSAGGQVLALELLYRQALPGYTRVGVHPLIHLRLHDNTWKA